MLDDKKNELLGIAAHDRCSLLFSISSWITITIGRIINNSLSSDRELHDLRTVSMAADSLMGLVAFRSAFIGEGA